MFNSDLLIFSTVSILVGSILNLIGDYFMTLLFWKIPNYFLSSLLFIFFQNRTNSKLTKKKPLPLTILNFRRIIVVMISDSIVVILWNILMSLVILPISQMSYVSHIILSYINAIMIYEFKPKHPLFHLRLKYYCRDPFFMLLLGYPLAWISLHPGLDWFSIHHIYNNLIFVYIHFIHYWEP